MNKFDLCFFLNAVLTHHDLLSVTAIFMNILTIFTELANYSKQTHCEIQTFKAKSPCTFSVYLYYYSILNHIALIKNSGNVAYEDSSIINSLYGHWKRFKLVLTKSNAGICIYCLTFSPALKWGGMNGCEFSSPASNRKRHRK